MTDETLMTEPDPRPRVPVAALMWGVLHAAFAVAVLWVISTPSRRTDLVDWALALNPAGITLLVVIAAGAFVLMIGIVAAVNSRKA